MKKIMLLLLFLYILFPENVFSSSKIAPYILDGSFVLYFPSLKKAEEAWELILRKTDGAEYQHTLSRIQMLIREKMSVNILDAQESAMIGIDPYKALSYVHLRDHLGYAIFTIANKRLLKATLDQLPNPIPYRIEDDFVIFSASEEILQYYEFRGLKSIEDFKRVAEAVNFDWKDNFIWIDSNYFKEKELNISADPFFLQGDRVAGIFDINEDNIIFDLYTFYDDPEINKYLKNSMSVTPIQKLSILDFEFGDPAIVGQMYLDFRSFFHMLTEIDRADILNIYSLNKKLKKQGFDLEEKIFRYLRGRFSYTVREFDPFNRKIDLTLMSEIQNARELKDNLKEFVRFSRSKSQTVFYKALFTNDFYGWKVHNSIFWVGIIEGHIIFSTNEETLVKLVDNVYEGRGSFMDSLPSSFNNTLARDSSGGQILFQNPSFLQYIRQEHMIFPLTFFSSLKSVEWQFFLMRSENQFGRRDIITMRFL